MNKKILIISVVWLLIDQISKLIVLNTLNNDVTVIRDFFFLTLSKNKGAAFGILDGNVFFLVIVSVIALLVLFKYINSENKNNWLVNITYGLLIGGIVGNLIDRIIYGYVIDFLSFKIVNYYFPIFNISDIGIVCGVFLLFVDMIWGGKNEKNRCE